MPLALNAIWKKFCVLQKKVLSFGPNRTVEVRPNSSAEPNVRSVTILQAKFFRRDHLLFYQELLKNSYVVSSADKYPFSCIWPWNSWRILQENPIENPEVFELFSFINLEELQHIQCSIKAKCTSIRANKCADLAIWALTI